MNLTKISLVILAAAVSGCAGTLQNLYEGESRPEREVSILSNVEYFLGSARVRSIDGIKVDNYGPRDSFSVLPGTHSVVGFLHSGGVFSHIVGPFCIRINAEAGRRYKLDGNWADDVISFYRGESWWMWIEDAETGEIIAESKKWTGYPQMTAHSCR
jgi:hypothetical protein